MSYNKYLSYLTVFTLCLSLNFSLAQEVKENTNNPIYPEATFEWNEEDGGIRKVWITWPDGRKESVNSLYSDDNPANGIDRFYVVLTNGLEQTVTIKDKHYLELREERKKHGKNLEKNMKKK